MATTVVQFPPAYFVRAPGQYFDVMEASSVSASSTETVVSYRVPNNMWGLLLGVAFEAGQLTNFWWGRFTLKIGEAAHENLNEVDGMISRITEPVPVWKPLKPNQLVRVMVENRNTNQNFQYAARLFGYVQEKRIQLAPGVDLEAMT